MSKKGLEFQGIWIFPKIFKEYTSLCVKQWIYVFPEIFSEYTYSQNI